MDIQGKIAHLNHFLTLSLKSEDSTKARKSLEVAQELMAEIECATLSNSWVKDENISEIVQITRSPLWSQAQGHIDSLRKGESVALTWVA